jgi:ribonucleoside-diphosphate reductase alpha chain
MTGIDILSDVTVWSKYARYIPELKRRETWTELVHRYLNMMVKKYPQLKDEIYEKGNYILEKKVLPSMRALQFSGKAIEVNNSRIYNCSYLPIDDYRAFSETMFLLLSGCGVGYSVQSHHIEKLPSIKVPTKTRKFVVDDSIMGWADAVKALMKAYFGFNNSRPDFDFSDIRPKGARLVTAGGKAPGPEPLKECLFKIQQILDRKKDKDRLTSLECHDILCHLANAVLAGGIRRSAMIALFDRDDEEMITCKYGNWWELNEQRGRANNSAVLVRGQVSQEEFDELWKRIELSGSGEPGIYWTNNKSMGTNPCCEIALLPNCFCNLTEINASTIVSQEDYNDRARVAAFFGTLQAGFTDLHYLRPIWKETVEKEALLGIGMTGIASDIVTKLDMKQAADITKQENERVAAIININKAARITCVKPSGTTSNVLGTSSGIHAWHSKYYLRTMRFGTNEAIVDYLKSTVPDLIEPDVLRPHDTVCFRVPVKATGNGIVRENETAIDLLNRVKLVSKDWVHRGHRTGDNTHNVSVTVSIKENEWDEVGQWMWFNKDYYNGIAVLPYWGGTYKQAPFEEISEEEYNDWMSKVKPIDLSQVFEEDDNVVFTDQAACAGGTCEA